MEQCRQTETRPWNHEYFDGVVKGDFLALDMSDDAGVVETTHGIALCKVCRREGES